MINTKKILIVTLCLCLFSCNRTKESVSSPEDSYSSLEYLQESIKRDNSNNQGNQHNNEYNNRVPSYNNESVNGRDYYVGKNGRVYENKACGYCSGSGYIQSYDMASGGQVANICNACDGAGQLSY